MSREATEDTPETIQLSEISINGPGNSKTHFLGIPHDTFSMKHRWNQIATNPAYATLNPVNEEEHAAPFHKAVKQFSASFTKRYQYLRENRKLIPDQLAAGEFGLDTSHLPDAGLGDQYMARRQDALIARILTLRSVTDFFPVRYHVQDREMITNAYFDEISQAYQTGEVWKGDMKLEPEWGHVDDAMVKTLFGPMKEIERKYIGYLNTDGSDPVKWSMIEFALLGLYKNILNEQNKRRMLGIYVKPEKKKPGSYLNASTGIIYTLIRYHHENRFLLHDDLTYREYDKTDILDSVQEFVEDIQTTLTEDQDLSGKILYLNYNHQPWWKKNIRRAYGQETDFKGPDSYLNKVPDTDVSIKWLPNLGQLN
ncbi:MAG: hypothetical protein LIP01_05285 [Tannerellaceae bacterium]|nr:hypothetical protein [Tannerellaceae bacterium]